MVIERSSPFSPPEAGSARLERKALCCKELHAVVQKTPRIVHIEKRSSVSLRYTRLTGACSSAPLDD